MTILTAYDPGVTFQVKEKGVGGIVWMPTTSINAQLPGIYTEDLAGNNAKLVTAQLESQISVPSFGGGSALVYIDYIVQA